MFSDELSDLGGKAVLVTGGTTGIGKAIAIALTERGAKPLIFGRNPDHLATALAEIGEGALGITADITKPNDVRKVFKMLDEKLGRLDILINNAAIGGATVDGADPAGMAAIIETNVTGLMACCIEAIPRMKKRGGHIVNVGSVSAQHRGKGSDIYTATKSALVGFSDALRKQVVDYGIRVTLIEPGRVGTDMTTDEMTRAEERKKEREGEMLVAEDIARGVVFALAQPARCSVSLIRIEPVMGVKD